MCQYLGMSLADQCDADPEELAELRTLMCIDNYLSKSEEPAFEEVLKATEEYVWLRKAAWLSTAAAGD